MPVLGDGENLATAVIWVGLLAALVGLVVGLRRSSRESRERYALLVVAMSALIAAQAIQSAGGLLIQDNDWYQNAFTYLADILSGLIAPFLFAYAILKQRVLDLGFAVNRTLVYGTTSFLLLAVFGISEWASEKFIPIREGDREGLVGACVALGIFLAFHRIRDIIERIVEDLFFRRWRDNEKALAHIRRRGRLLRQKLRPRRRHDRGTAALLGRRRGRAVPRRQERRLRAG